MSSRPPVPNTLPPTLAVQRALDSFDRVPSYEENFDLVEEVGRGGMGAVHRGHDRRLGRSVAIKVVLKDVVGDRGIVRRFMVEAQLGAQLEHPNIVPVYGLVATPDKEPAFVMRLVDGETMDAYLRGCGVSAEGSRTAPLDLASRLERFLKVCDAIEYAHSRGVLHRDLKPENVMLGVYNEVYVMDWGIARVDGDLDFDHDHDHDHDRDRDHDNQGPETQKGDVFGSPGYMAPEQARSETITKASDQYALGVFLAEIVTLKPARPGTSLMQLSEAMLGTPIALSHRFGEAIPRELGAIIAKATAPLPGDRYPSIAELAADVRRYLRGEAVSVAPDPRWVVLWRWMRRRPALVLGTLLALVVFVGLTLVISLARELDARERASAQADRMSALTAAVDRTARTLDARFQRMELLVESLSKEAEGIMHRPPSPQDKPLPSPTDLAPDGSGAELVDRYQQRVTFDHAVHVRSPGIDAQQTSPIMARTSELELALLHTSARAASDDPILDRSTEDQSRAAHDRSPVLWTDLGFEVGELLVYPGNTFFPTDFDVRQRPWYTLASSRKGPVWGAPYGDATSGRLLVPCSRAFFDLDGKLEGVAALHMRLDDVLDLLIVPTDGFEWAALVDQDGRIVLSTKERGVQLDAGIGPPRPRGAVRDPFPVESIRRAIAAHASSGRTKDGGSLVVFQALDTDGWYLAVSVDAAPYAFR